MRLPHLYTDVFTFSSNFDFPILCLLFQMCFLWRMEGTSANFTGNNANGHSSEC